MINKALVRKVNNYTNLLGYTQVVKLSEIGLPGSATLWGKCEFHNPTFSVKFRIGASMIEAAETQERLLPGGLVIEPTSGNTGIALAQVCAAKGYRLIATMPGTVSKERTQLLRAYGAQVYLVTPDEKEIDKLESYGAHVKLIPPEDAGMKGAIKLADELAKEHNGYIPNQFANPANPKIHELTTGPEIVAAFQGIGLDAFVSGVGTGGTITGAGLVLRQYFPGITIVAVEPSKSPVLSGGEKGPHAIQGIGAGFIPPVLNQEIYDHIIQVDDEEAKETARRLARTGLLVGISSGAAVHAALKVAEDLGEGKNVLAILPDLGERYLSTALFN